MSNNHNQNLFEATKPLPIPNLLKDYILFWVSPDDDQEEFDTKFNKKKRTLKMTISVVCFHWDKGICTSESEMKSDERVYVFDEAD